jgi:hypothetical protein
MFPDAFESRAGAVLSRENLADLQDAVNAIQRVIERGMKAKSGDYDEDDMTPRAAEAAVVETPDEVLTRILSAIKES